MLVISLPSRPPHLWGRLFGHLLVFLWMQYPFGLGYTFSSVPGSPTPVFFSVYTCQTQFFFLSSPFFGFLPSCLTSYLRLFESYSSPISLALSFLFISLWRYLICLVHSFFLSSYVTLSFSYLLFCFSPFPPSFSPPPSFPSSLSSYSSSSSLCGSLSVSLSLFFSVYCLMFTRCLSFCHCLAISISQGVPSLSLTLFLSLVIFVTYLSLSLFPYISASLKTK